MPALSKSSIPKSDGGVVAAKPPVSLSTCPAHLSLAKPEDARVAPTTLRNPSGYAYYTRVSLVSSRLPRAVSPSGPPLSRQYSGRAPVPAELHTLTFGDEEQIVPDLFEVLVEKGEQAEPAVLVRPDKGRQVSYHGAGRGEAPGVGELEALLREVHQDVPPLVGRHLEVTRQVSRR